MISARVRERRAHTLFVSPMLRRVMVASRQPPRRHDIARCFAIPRQQRARYDGYAALCYFTRVAFLRLRRAY